MQSGKSFTLKAFGPEGVALALTRCATTQTTSELGFVGVGGYLILARHYDDTSCAGHPAEERAFLTQRSAATFTTDQDELGAGDQLPLRPYDEHGKPLAARLALHVPNGASAITIQGAGREIDGRTSPSSRTIEFSVRRRRPGTLKLRTAVFGFSPSGIELPGATGLLRQDTCVPFDPTVVSIRRRGLAGADITMRAAEPVELAAFGHLTAVPRGTVRPQARGQKLVLRIRGLRRGESQIAMNTFRPRLYCSTVGSLSLTRTWRGVRQPETPQYEPGPE